MHHPKDEKSPLRLSEKEIEEAVCQYLANKGVEEARRIKHVVLHSLPDEHSYSPIEAHVYLHPAAAEQGQPPAEPGQPTEAELAGAARRLLDGTWHVDGDLRDSGVDHIEYFTISEGPDELASGAGVGFDHVLREAIEAARKGRA